MDVLLKHLNEAIDISGGTWFVIVMMAGIGMYFVREHLVMPALVVVLGPMVVGIALLANYGMSQLEIFNMGKFDQWLICTITAATVGLIVTLLIAAGLARIGEHFQANRAFETQN
jgi:hypothetical protein